MSKEEIIYNKDAIDTGIERILTLECILDEMWRKHQVTTDHEERLIMVLKAMLEYQSYKDKFQKWVNKPCGLMTARATNCNGRDI